MTGTTRAADSAERLAAHSPVFALDPVFSTTWARLLTSVGLAPPLRFHARSEPGRPGYIVVTLAGFPWLIRRALGVLRAAGWQCDEISAHPRPGLLRERWDVVIPRKASARA